MIRVYRAGWARTAAKDKRTAGWIEARMGEGLQAVGDDALLLEWLVLRQKLNQLDPGKARGAERVPMLANDGLLFSYTNGKNRCDCNAS